MEFERTSIEKRLRNALVVLYYPAGTTVIDYPGGQEIGNHVIAMHILQDIANDSRVAIPYELDENGCRNWELKVFDLDRRPIDELQDLMQTVENEAAPLKPMTAERYDEIMIEKMGKADQDG